MIEFGQGSGHAVVRIVDIVPLHIHNEHGLLSLPPLSRPHEHRHEITERVETVSHFKKVVTEYPLFSRPENVHLAPHDAQCVHNAVDLIPHPKASVRNPLWRFSHQD